MAHILIAGLGDLGSGVARHWRDTGRQVSAIRRRPEGPQGVDIQAGDLNEAAVLLPPDRVDLLYIILSPEEHSQADYNRTFLGAPLNLLDALAKQQPLPPVVFVSSTAVFGNAGDVVDENTPPRPERYNGRILLAAEEELSTRAMTTAVRFSGIYGPGRGHLLRQVEHLRAGEEPPALRWTNRIHREDCVRLLVHLGEHWLAGEMQPALVVGTDAEPAPNRAVLNWISAQMGEPLNLSVEGEPGGKRVQSRYLAESALELRYPDYRAGYTEVLRTSGKPKAENGRE